MNEEFSCQFERARELYVELQRECTKRVTDFTISSKIHPRIPILTGEVLNKLQTILDHTAFQVYQIKVKSNHPEYDEGQNRKVQFPIVDKEEKFNEKLKKSKLDDLINDSDSTYAILRAAQPFSSGENLWLAKLRDLSNIAKHRDLVRAQKSAVRGTADKMLPGHKLGVNYRDYEYRVVTPFYDRRSRKKIRGRYTVYLLCFMFDKGDLNVLRFLDHAISKTEKLAAQILKDMSERNSDFSTSTT